MTEPILVMAMPRSGSSMLTGILHAHGAWVGVCNPGDRNNPRGYFENTRIKAATRRWMGGINWAAEIIPFRAGWRAEVEAQLEAQGYPGGRWVYKDSALKWRMWGEFDPWWVKVRRDHDSVFASCKRMRFPDPRLTDNELHARIDLHNRVLDEIPGVDVYTPDIVAGNYEGLKTAFGYLEMPFDAQIVDEFVIGDAWRYGGQGRLRASRDGVST